MGFTPAGFAGGDSWAKRKRERERSKKGYFRMSRSILPKIVIFGDPKKGSVAEVIEEFSDFVKGKAAVVARCGIEECTADILETCDFAVVFGGDGSIISAGRTLSQSKVPVVGVNIGKL